VNTGADRDGDAIRVGDHLLERMGASQARPEYAHVG
jgi:hypothetical protein